MFNSYHQSWCRKNYKEAICRTAVVLFLLITSVPLAACSRHKDKVFSNNSVYEDIRGESDDTADSSVILSEEIHDPVQDSDNDLIAPSALEIDESIAGALQTDESLSQNGDSLDESIDAKDSETTPESIEVPLDSPSENPLNEETTDLTEDEPSVTEGDTNDPDYDTSSRILFVGDSRTIDMFDDSDEPVDGRVIDGILVYAKHGHGYEYLMSVVENEVGIDNFDTIITWMGANDRGYFDTYGIYYDALLELGKEVIVCTIGPTDNTHLTEGDSGTYTDELMQSFNNDLVTWAEERQVKIIDLYSFILQNDEITIDEVDGIHYLPRPTTQIWSHILKVRLALEAKVPTPDECARRDRCNKTDLP